MQPDTQVWVNGDRADTVPFNDRGLMYGDGLFETIAIKQGKPMLWDLHMQRLLRGCERLKIHPPEISLLHAEASKLCTDYLQCVLKIIITRGVGSRGYRPDSSHVATRILYCTDWPDYSSRFYTEGIHAAVCKTRLALNPLLAGIKHLNRLEQVMARGEWSDEFAEGLMLNSQDRVIEGTMSNVFIIRDNVLFTPALDECGVRGVMREHILDMARDLKFEVYICELTLQEVLQADGVFFCNSLIGVWPVNRLMDCVFPKHALIDKISSSLEVS